MKTRLTIPVYKDKKHHYLTFVFDNSMVSAFFEDEPENILFTGEQEDFNDVFETSQFITKDL